MVLLGDGGTFMWWDPVGNLYVIEGMPLKVWWDPVFLLFVSFAFWPSGE
jgi:hypothetical protein